MPYSSNRCTNAAIVLIIIEFWGKKKKEFFVAVQAGAERDYEDGIASGRRYERFRLQLGI
jgi:hypothetical protein